MFTITLPHPNGKTIAVNRIHVSRTYGGMLEGRPTSKTNTRLIEGAREDAKRMLHGGEHLPTHVVEPKRTPVEVAPSRFSGRFSGLGKPENIPPIQVFMTLSSWTAIGSSWTAIGEDGHGSHVIVVCWLDLDADKASWKEQFRPTIEALDWDDIAMDFWV